MLLYAHRKNVFTWYMSLFLHKMCGIQKKKEKRTACNKYIAMNHFIKKVNYLNKNVSNKPTIFLK